jgi:hypothetical protein
MWEDNGYQMLKPEVRLRSSRPVSPCHVEAQGAAASVGASKSSFDRPIAR